MPEWVDVPTGPGWWLLRYKRSEPGRVHSIREEEGELYDVQGQPGRPMKAVMNIDWYGPIPQDPQVEEDSL